MTMKRMYDDSDLMPMKSKITKKYHEKKHWSDHDIQSEEIRVRRKVKYGVFSLMDQETRLDVYEEM